MTERGAGRTGGGRESELERRKGENNEGGRQVGGYLYTSILRTLYTFSGKSGRTKGGEGETI